MCKPLINTSAEYDDISDDADEDEDEEEVVQYGTSAWTSDPTQEVERSLQLFLGQCETLLMLWMEKVIDSIIMPA